MEIGMLWYDDSPIALKERVTQAAGYYSEKYGRKPNLCLVHPGMLQTDEVAAQGVVIRKGKGIMPGHFWIGVDEGQVKANGDSKAKNGTKSQVSGSKQAKPKAQAKATAEAKSKTVAKPKPSEAKPGSEKSKTKPPAEKRTRVLLKKSGQTRVEKTTTMSKPKSSSKGSGAEAKAKTKRS